MLRIPGFTERSDSNDRGQRCRATDSDDPVTEQQQRQGGPAFTLDGQRQQLCFRLGGAVERGSARTTTFVGATQLTAAIPASDIAAAGTAQVRVANPGGGTSNALTFTITSPGFTLTVTRSGNGTVTSTPTGHQLWEHLCRCLLTRHSRDADGHPPK